MEIKTSWFDTAPEHSNFAESERDQFTLWLKIKDRYSGNIVLPGQLKLIREWLKTNHIKYECRRDGDWGRIPDIQMIRYANQFYFAIFPRNEIEMNAVKIVWGEYLSSRRLEKTNAMC